MPNGFLIGESLLTRIRASVDVTEKAIRQETPHSIATRLEGEPAVFAKKIIRFGQVSAAWNKGAYATVEWLHPDGSERDGNPTFSALNQFASLAAPAAGEKRFVMCAYVETTWMLVAAECD